MMTNSLKIHSAQEGSPPSPGESAAQGSHSTFHQPTYAGAFRCIGPQCEDTCCGDWDIPVDKVTYREYRQFPAEKLGVLVSRYVLENPVRSQDKLHAFIHRKQDGSCPFFGSDRLCGIQKEYGTKLLTSTCSLYPRSLTLVNGTLEGALSLSCPEAARSVLLSEDSTQKTANLFSGEFRTDNVFRVRPHSGLHKLVLPIRNLIVALIRDRSRPLWQRLLLVASLCCRLDGVAGKGESDVTKLLARYESALGEGASSELNRLEPSIALRLELAIALSDRRCRDRDCGQRFQGVFWDFIEGIGSSSGEGPEEDVRRFSKADRNHLSPTLDRFPFILENYLLNHIYQHMFPFGRTGSDRFVEHSMFDEAVLLITRFSWLTTLLTGVAGHYGDDFSSTHIITTVQSYTRAVEHAPHILEDALYFVKSRDLDMLPGLGKLLRT